jgi:transcriptional regulator with XRE-family HTH domain
LRNAALSLGGIERLAEELGVAASALEEWLRGDSAPPFDVFSRALDIVARGPFMPGKPKSPS